MLTTKNENCASFVSRVLYNLADCARKRRTNMLKARFYLIFYKDKFIKFTLESLN